MSNNKTTHIIEWRRITIEIDYDPDYSASFKEFNKKPLAHITVRAAQALPITETGYLSHFIETEYVDEAGGPVALVTDALDDAAKDSSWEKQQAKDAQLSLF